MSRLVFFNILAYGHTNPTIEVVRELVNRGHEVIYYSFKEFKDRIEDTGAVCICCDEYLPELQQKDVGKVGKDFALLVDMLVDTTLALDEKICQELLTFKPDCIVSDSLCFWGKLFAKKLKIPYICSTTTFAFNQYTAKMMKPTFKENVRMILGLGRINKKIKLLRDHGYEVHNFVEIVENNNETPTIVYTSKEFQPLVETFSDKYFFVGPSIKVNESNTRLKNRPSIYISLGTVNNKNNDFYKNCIQAFKDCEVEVIMSVGNSTDIDSLGVIPTHFTVNHSVKQVEVLQQADVFITHCGMNSVNESLYCGVPMVLFPQHSEQRMVGKRVYDLGAGLMLKRNQVEEIKNRTFDVLNNKQYKENATKLSKSFHDAGGSEKAVDAILQIINKS